MNDIKDFKDLGIEVEQTSFIGEKIDKYAILNQPLEIHDYKIAPSKFEGKGECITMQIVYNGEKRVLFIWGKPLKDALDKIGKHGLPFRAKIVKENRTYYFRSTK